jgi:hypothetical protein
VVYILTHRQPVPRSPSGSHFSSPITEAPSTGGNNRFVAAPIKSTQSYDLLGQAHQNMTVEKQLFNFVSAVQNMPETTFKDEYFTVKLIFSEIEELSNKIFDRTRTMRLLMLDVLK